MEQAPPFLGTHGRLGGQGAPSGLMGWGRLQHGHSEVTGGCRVQTDSEDGPQTPHTQATGQDDAVPGGPAGPLASGPRPPHPHGGRTPGPCRLVTRAAASPPTAAEAACSHHTRRCSDSAQRQATEAPTYGRPDRHRAGVSGGDTDPNSGQVGACLRTLGRPQGSGEAGRAGWGSQA